MDLNPLHETTRALTASPAITRALIVDDDGAMARLLEECFRTRGMTTLIARSGDEALRAVHEMHPDIVLLDVALPGSANGLEVLAAIRERHLDTAVILTTGLGSEE